MSIFPRMMNLKLNNLMKDRVCQLNLLLFHYLDEVDTLDDVDIDDDVDTELEVDTL